MKVLRSIRLFLPIQLSTISVGSYIRGLYLKKVIKSLSISRVKKTLDAGCGDGGYAKWFAKKYPSVRVNAYDIDLNELWKNKPKNLTFEKVDLLKLNEKDVYDFCYCIDVLNCMPKNRMALANICSSLKSGGYLYLHIPSKNQKRIFFKKYFRKYDSIFNKRFSGQLYSKSELRKIITSLGFEVVKVYNTFGIFGKIAWEINTFVDSENKILLKILLTPLLKLLSLIDCNFITNKEGNGILFIAKKR